MLKKHAQPILVISTFSINHYPLESPTSALLTEEQISALAPTPAALKAGQKLAQGNAWQNQGHSDRALWAEVQGSGKEPYLTRIDTESLGYKCTCPSRQFPCKHAVGLLLLRSRQGAAFPRGNEPEWVSEWIDRRRQRESKKEEPEPEATPQKAEKKAQQKATTTANRLELVLAGATDLQQWLEDLVRIGWLSLPQKPPTEFAQVAA
ncbi:MAG TPA: hypothetical protein DCE41_37515, partial [Cytophagales bacterium]|nr:hypothetical protein [Cytophagales bacterium]